ncbi:MAG: Gfo/Idh/MocA family oxidoreductase [Bacteroidota bacterium]
MENFNNKIIMRFFNKLLIYFFIFIIAFAELQAQTSSQKPIRLAVAGMTHSHIAFFFGRKNKSDFILVGIYEPNREMALRYAKKYDFDPKLIYDNLDKMLDAVKPEAVVAFGSILEHTSVVESCAPRGINVMVEKPLATTVKYAERMEELAKKYHIHLLTDYETSWYPSTAKSIQLVNDSDFVGNVRKVIIHDGHQGPKEINVNKEFLDWLTDPVQNGAGALFDFGCYGANLMTCLQKGEEPVSVTAVTRQFKPDVYPKVDDDATVIVDYPDAQCVLMPSWNWPFNRKDMEIYGVSGYIIDVDNSTMHLRNRNMSAERTIQVTSKDVQVDEDPFSYFADVLNGKIKVPEYGLYSLENNVLVIKILEAAKISAETGRTVKFDR